MEGMTGVIAGARNLVGTGLPKSAGKSEDCRVWQVDLVPRYECQKLATIAPYGITIDKTLWIFMPQS